MLETQSSCHISDYDLPVKRQTVLKKKSYAKAIYDNVAEASDELSFKRGDILLVIEEDPDGMPGWWLCSLRGKQGLCPANRLQVQSAYDSGCFSLSPSSSPSLSLSSSTFTLNGSICSADIFESISEEADSFNQNQLQQQGYTGFRKSWQNCSNKASSPLRNGDAFVCCPTSRIHGNQRKTNFQNFSSPFITEMMPTIPNNCHKANNCSNNVIYNRSNHEFETYDIPKPATPVNYDSPKNIMKTVAMINAQQFRSELLRSNATLYQEDSYDVPRPLNTSIQKQETLTPSSSNSSLLTSDSLSLSYSSSNRSSLVNIPDYDIPRRNPLAIRAAHQAVSAVNSPSLTSIHQKLQECGIEEKLNKESSLQTSNAAEPKELPLELNSALETLVKLQTEATTAITMLLSFVSSNWRLPSKLETVLMDIKLAVVRLRIALHDLREFSEGALGNATRSEDRSLAFKLNPLVRALRDADNLVQHSADILDTQDGWTLEKLSRLEDTPTFKPDSLDQLIACAQTLTEDVRQTTSFIQGNASLLFKRQLYASNDKTNLAETTSVSSHPEIVLRRKENNFEWLEDYDYVSLESKDATAKKNIALREAIASNLKTKFDNEIQTAEMNAIASAQTSSINVENDNSQIGSTQQHNDLTPKDIQIIRFYAKQISTHLCSLHQAIESFLETVEKNQPPKFFIAYGKFVVVSAHNLIASGDILCRNISKPELRDKLMMCTDNLSDALKICVNKSKNAATHFPSVTAVQEMVDSVAGIRIIAKDLRDAVIQAVQSTK